MEQLLSRGHVMLATPTASGKSLAYNLPVLHAAATQPEARAVYIFPTKALAHDQLRALRSLASQGRRVARSGSPLLSVPPPSAAARGPAPSPQGRTALRARRRDLRRRHAAGGAARAARGQPRPPHQPRHAPHGGAARAQGVGKPALEPPLRRRRRGATAALSRAPRRPPSSLGALLAGAHVLWRLRRARRLRPPPPAPAGGDVRRRRLPVRLLLCDARRLARALLPPTRRVLDVSWTCPIGNPRELFCRLTGAGAGGASGEPLLVVDWDGSPRGRRQPK